MVHVGNVAGSGRTRIPPGVRTVLVILALVAASVAVMAPATSAQPEASPCRGGEGTCVPGGRFEKKLSFTTTTGRPTSCDWVLDIDWGDGSAEQFLLRTDGMRDVSYFHTFGSPGVYTVATSGVGTPVGSGYTCTFDNHINIVEVVPRGARLCEGVLATIVGTDRSERIRGTNGDDVIVALGGNDVIDGRGGDDRICAGGGNDTVRGGAGNDVIYAGAGNDKVFGQGGLDIVFGEAGRDRIVGGPGIDLLSGGPGRDVLVGNGGDDLLIGGEGRDTCRGGSGDNTILSCER
jgi:Ca2+-binding RTX toxin-like protein